MVDKNWDVKIIVIDFVSSIHSLHYTNPRNEAQWMKMEIKLRKEKVLPSFVFLAYLWKVGRKKRRKSNSYFVIIFTKIVGCLGSVYSAVLCVGRQRLPSAAGKWFGIVSLPPICWRLGERESQRNWLMANCACIVIRKDEWTLNDLEFPRLLLWAL